MTRFKNIAMKIGQNRRNTEMLKGERVTGSLKVRGQGMEKVERNGKRKDKEKGTRDKTRDRVKKSER